MVVLVIVRFCLLKTVYSDGLACRIPDCLKTERDKPEEHYLMFF